jgi:DNA-3-methyladenine glycosylase II
VPVEFSLAQTCAPVHWGKGRWPNQDWIDGYLVSIGTESGGTTIREVRQPFADAPIQITSNRDTDPTIWAQAVLGVFRDTPKFDDVVVNSIQATYPGMRPFSNGSLFDGIVTAIIGQSISVQAAAVTERKLAELYSRGVDLAGRRFWPMPTAEQLANSDGTRVRLSGVTQRRADAIVDIARRFVSGALPHDVAHMAADEVYEMVLSLPLVGKWTAESVLLWGLGSDDSYPVGDVALLRACRLAWNQPELTHGEMNQLSEAWRPFRSWASRLLWLNLFGPAPGAIEVR